MNLQENCQSILKKISDKNQYREIYPYKSMDSVNIISNKKKYISFSSNDYLGLASNIEVISALNGANMNGVSINGVSRNNEEENCSNRGEKGYNVAGASASRLITGSCEKYVELEKNLALMKRTEDCCVFGSGYLTNIGVIPALINRYDLLVSDKLVHACIIDGAKLSGATHKRFKHNDVADLEKILKKHRDNYKNCLIITETVFSMDGDIAPVENILNIAEKYNCWTMTDDAHGFGVVDLSKNFTKKVNLQPDLQMGTLSKSVGTYGGYICANKDVISLIKNTARSLIFSTALPQSVIEASIASLNIMQNSPELSEKVLENSRYFTNGMGLDKAQSAIVPYIVNCEEKAMELSAFLKEDGFLVSAIRPPTVPKNSSRLRFTFSSLHNKEMINRLMSSLKNITY